MTLEEKKAVLEDLFKQSNNLFKTLPKSRKEFDEVQEKISRVLLNKKPQQLFMEF